MLATLASIILIPFPLVVWIGLGLLANIAEYQENPVIELVEALRKKHSNTNEN